MQGEQFKVHHLNAALSVGLKQSLSAVSAVCGGTFGIRRFRAIVCTIERERRAKTESESRENWLWSQFGL